MFKTLFINLSPHPINAFRTYLTEKEELTLASIVDSGTDAIEAVESSAFEFIVIDMTHSNRRGLELCKLIRQYHKKPILLFGGDRDFNLVREAISLQVCNYITHPLDVREVNECLASVVTTLSLEKEKAYQLALANNETDEESASANIIDQVKDALESALCEPITLREIADRFHYNPSYLGQKFKAQEQVTFNQYLLKRRMLRAQYLLQHTDMKIYQVANEVGYNDLDWFYKKFKSFTGLSASSYRTKRSMSLYVEKQIQHAH